METFNSLSFSVGAFKAKLSAILREVSQGREFIVTDHNRPVAKIVPITRIPPLPACDFRSFFKQPRLRLKSGAPTSAELIRKIRDEDGER